MLSLAVLLLCSCAKIEREDAAYDAPITFQAVVARPAPEKMGTKAIVDGLTYPTGEDYDFCAVGYFDNGDSRRYYSDGTTAVEWIPKSTVGYNGAAKKWMIKETQGTDTSFPSYYWPLAGSLTFMAYSPASLTPVEYDAVDVAGEISMDARHCIKLRWDATAAKCTDVDFMVADPVTDIMANESNGGYVGVPIVFRHMLAKVKVSAAREGTDDIRIKSLRIKNIDKSGTFSATMANDIWGSYTYLWAVDEGSTYTRTLVEYSDSRDYMILTQEYNPVGEACLMIPQGLADTKMLEVTYVQGGNEKTEDLKLNLGSGTFKWERGKEIHYRLGFGDQMKINFSGSSGGWSGTGDLTL